MNLKVVILSNVSTQHSIEFQGYTISDSVTDLSERVSNLQLMFGAYTPVSKNNQIVTSANITFRAYLFIKHVTRFGHSPTFIYQRYVWGNMSVSFVEGPSSVPTTLPSTKPLVNSQTLETRSSLVIL